MTNPTPTPQQFVVAQPTQSQHPWHAMARTVLAAIIALLPLLPGLADALGITAVPVVATILVIAAAVTRALAWPPFNEWLQRYLPLLAAAPDPKIAERVNGAYVITDKGTVIGTYQNAGLTETDADGVDHLDDDDHPGGLER